MPTPVDPLNPRKEYGFNPEYILQPDVTVSDNGYGLLQLQANYVADASLVTNAPTIFFRGAGFNDGAGSLKGFQLGPKLKGEKWTCVRSETKGRDGGLINISVNYAAVSKLVGGVSTITEATITSAVVSEPIEAHPNFSKIQVEKIGDGKPLGGTWDGNTPPEPKYDAEKNPFIAYWGPVTGSTGGVVTYNFSGFLPTKTGDNKANRKAGVRSWMRPSVTMRLTGYTTDETLATDTARKTWWVVKDKVGFLNVPLAYQKLLTDDLGTINLDVSTKGKNEKNWIVTSTNMEVYGGLYKVTADLLMSGVLGWDPDIYPYAY